MDWIWNGGNYRGNLKKNEGLVGKGVRYKRYIAAKRSLEVKFMRPMTNDP